MSDQLVTYESVDGVAVITLHRPDKLNALNAELGRELRAAWQRLNDGDDRVAILTGAGDRAFSVGADLAAPPDIWPFAPGIGIEVEKPIIAAIGGWCIGGAAVLAMCADLCVATEDARFSYPEAKIGFSGGLISAIVARIPHKVAMEFILLGEDLTAQRAYEVGFVNKVVPAGELMPAAMEYANRLKANAPMVLALLKRFAATVLPKGPSELGGIARRDVERVSASLDFEEGLAAFREKRPPRFTGS